MPDAAREGYELLAAFTDEQGTPLFPGLTARFIQVSPTLTGRLAIARVLMHIEEEPDLLEKSACPAAGDDGVRLWLAPDERSGPHQGCLSRTPVSLRLAVGVVHRLPAAPRAGHLRPRHVRGRSAGGGGRVAQVFFPAGALASGGGPAISRTHTAAATTWWVMQMNKLLSELSDFSNYCNADETFVPRRLFEMFMSVEQAGRRLQGILAHDRDLATRRALAFDAFDTMQGLGIVDLFEVLQAEPGRARTRVPGR